MSYTGDYDLAADRFENQPPSYILEHQSKYTENQLDIQDQANCSMLGPIYRKNYSRYREYEAHLMNQGEEVTDIVAQHDQMIENAAGRQMTESELLRDAEQNQQRHDQLFGKGDCCPLCEKKYGQSKRYTSEHAFQFHLRRHHRPECPNCHIRLVQWDDYSSHLPYCARKFRHRLKPGLDRRTENRGNRPVRWETHTWRANGHVHHTVTER